MCGINGILGSSNNPTEQIEKMNSRIIHRGPDASGVWVSNDNAVAFGHQRLAIIDLTPSGAQPMVSESGKYVIVFNGEIYNFQTIKKQLKEEFSDVVFKGTSDTEMLLWAIEKYGIEKTLRLIKGMFAFAVYEADTNTVYIARDRMGEKPLYYGRVRNTTVFASDIGSIEKISGFDNEIDTGVMASFFKGGYIPAPFTIYKDIYKLEPGKYLTIKAPYNQWKEGTYWSISEVASAGQQNPFDGTFEEASDRLEEMIKESIRGQMISDVPLGAFLSGGIDSTLTVALMQSMSEKPVSTFTIGFEDPKYNEAVYAKETAAHLGTVHTEMYVTKKDILDTIESIPVAFSEPFADSSQIPTMLVSKMTKQHVTVSLSGDAGDEFYCGYNTYRDVNKGLEVLASKLPVLKGGLRKRVGNAVYAVGGRSNPTLHKVATALTVQTAEDWYRNVRETEVLLDRLCRTAQHRDKIESYEDGFLNGNEPNLMLMDMLQYLPDDILVKVDRAGMMYSLESRIPLLDRDVCEFAWTLPQEYKYDGITTKRILKNILYKYVPEEMMNRPKKGFSVPLESWLRGNELKPWAESLLRDSRQSMGEFVDYSIVDLMWNKFLETGKGERNIWNILMLAQWFTTRS